MGWNVDDSRPIWPQLKAILMKDIVAGRYEMGGAFPTVRELAEEAGVNRNTMQRALSELENEGLVITNRTTGRTVTTDEELVAGIKAGIAAEKVDTFMNEMASLGYDADEVINIIKRKRKGVENK